MIGWSDGAVLIGTALQLAGVAVIAKEIRGTRTGLALSHEPWWRRVRNKWRKPGVVDKEASDDAVLTDDAWATLTPDPLSLARRKDQIAAVWKILRDELRELAQRTHEQLTEEQRARRSADDDLKLLADRIDERYRQLAVGSLPIKAWCVADRYRARSVGSVDLPTQLASSARRAAVGRPIN